MSKVNSTPNKILTEEAKQKMSLANEVVSKNAFTKAHAIAGRLSMQLVKRKELKLRYDRYQLLDWDYIC